MAMFNSYVKLPEGTIKHPPYGNRNRAMGGLGFVETLENQLKERHKPGIFFTGGQGSVGDKVG